MPSDKLVKIATFDSRLEAETIGHALDQYDIPFLVKSEDVGVFGPGHIGKSVWPATLWVPAEHAEEVKELLRCVAEEAEDQT